MVFDGVVLDGMVFDGMVLDGMVLDGIGWYGIGWYGIGYILLLTFVDMKTAFLFLKLLNFINRWRCFFVIIFQRG